MQADSWDLVFLAAGRKCSYGNAKCSEYCKSSLHELSASVCVCKGFAGFRADSSARKAKGSVPREPRGWQSFGATRTARGISIKWFPCPWLPGFHASATVQIVIICQVCLYRFEA